MKTAIKAKASLMNNVAANILPKGEVKPLGKVQISEAVMASKVASHNYGSVMKHKMSSGYSVADTIPHIVAMHDKLELLQHQVLDIYRAIGLALIEIRAIIGKSDKLFGQFVGTTELAQISRQDRSDCIWIAENWAAVQAANNSGRLDSLSANRIRVLLKETKPRQTVAKPEAKASTATATVQPKAVATVGATDTKAVAEPKAAPKAEPKPEPVAMTPAELAAETLVKLDTYGISVAEFAAALMAQVKARQG